MDRTQIFCDPNFMNRVREMGRVFAMSQLFGVKNEEQGTVFAIEMISNNRSPFEMMHNYHVIQGKKVTLAATAMLEEFHDLGGKHKVVEYSPEACEIIFTYGGSSLPVRITYHDALQEKWPYDKNGGIIPNWATPVSRGAMLFARVTTRGIRAVCPKATSGTYAPEELENEFVTPNYSTFGQEQTQTTLAAISRRDSDPCDQVQLDAIQRLGDDVSKFDPEILNKVMAQLTALGKTRLSQLTWKEAGDLESVLSRKVGEHVLGESQAASTAENP